MDHGAVPGGLYIVQRPSPAYVAPALRAHSAWIDPWLEDRCFFFGAASALVIRATDNPTQTATIDERRVSMKAP